jgi:hypothetical protein
VIALSSLVRGVGADRVQDVVFSAGRHQVAISDQGQVRLWDAATGKFVAGWTGTTENFVRIGHSLITLVVA